MFDLKIQDCIELFHDDFGHVAVFVLLDTLIELISSLFLQYQQMLHECKSQESVVYVLDFLN